MVYKKDGNIFSSNSRDKIDELKDELYSRKTGKIKIERKKLKKKKIDFKNTWGKKKSQNNLGDRDLYTFKKKGTSIFSIIFMMTLIFFIGAISFASFLFLFNKNEVRSEINMSIIGPNSVKSGEFLEFLIVLENTTDLDYKDIEFRVNYPDSAIDSVEKDFIKHEIKKYPEKLLSGGKIEQKFSVILSGIRDEKKEIKVDVSYKAGEFSNLLFLSKIYDVKIESSPVTIEMNYPKEVLSKKDFTVTISILSNSSELLQDLILIGKYPLSFIISDTSPKAVFSNETQSIFEIDELKAGGKKVIEIKGSLSGQNNEEKFFNFTLGDAVPFRNEMRTLFSKIEKVISIKKPDINLVIISDFDNSNSEAIVPAGEKVSFRMNLSNNLPSLMSDLKITSFLSDSLINKREVNVSKGFYNSNENKIVWNKNTDRFLKSLSKNGSIEEIFNLEIKELKDIAGYVKDPKIVLDFEVEGTNFNVENSDGYIREKFKKIVKIPTNVSLETDIFYERGPFDNLGSVQPKVGEATTYTVAWKIYNSSSDIFDVEVSAKLPLYVNYVNNTFPKNSYFSYNEDTREVKLSFNKIDAFIGYRTDPKTVYFQVEIVPTSPQIGSKPVLVGQKVLKARDNFLNREIEIKVDKKTTDLKNDSIGGFEIGTVRE